jgi:hypothetical protein
VNWQAISPWFHRFDLVLLAAVILLLVYLVWHRLKH